MPGACLTDGVRDMPWKKMGMQAMPYTFEEMADRHRNAVINIFNYFVVNSWAAYPEEPVGDYFFDYLQQVSRGYPSVVIKVNPGGVIGFALLRPHLSAKAFTRTAEITYFIMPEHTRQGLGRLILERFVPEARKMGVDNILANISSHNEPSLQFHRKMGFLECGRFRNVGRKFGEDFDVVWMQLPLQQSGPP